MKKKLLIVVLLLSAILLVGCGKDDEGGSSKKGVKGAKEAVTTLMDAYKKGDGKKACKAILPAYMEDSFDSLDDCVEEFEDEFSELDNFKYEIVEYEEVEDEDYDEIVDFLVDEYDYSEKKIGKIYLYEVKVTYSMDEDDDEEKLEVYAIQYDSKWYVVLD